MKVKCTDIQLNDKQKKSLGIPKTVRPKFQLTVGKIYTVLGITFHIQSHFYGSGVTVEICDDPGRCATVPLCLFEITDQRPSSFWRIRRSIEYECGCTIWPDEFYIDYFHDDLSEGSAEVVSIFKGLVKKLEDEYR